MATVALTRAAPVVHCASVPEPVADRPERIGVFGGTFDPPHVGHLVTAVNVRHALGLDRLLLVVANRPWQKEGMREITPAERAPGPGAGRGARRRRPGGQPPRDRPRR